MKTLVFLLDGMNIQNIKQNFQLMDLVMNTALDPSTLAEISVRIDGMTLAFTAQQQIIVSGNLSANSTSVSSAIIAPSAAPSILPGLSQHPVVIGSSSTPSLAPQSWTPKQIHLTHDDIQTTHANGYQSIYDALELQCKQCGLRFKKEPYGKKDRMAAHLDWHFRQNRRLRDKLKVTVSRAWYLTDLEWVSEVIVDVHDRQAAVAAFDVFGGSGGADSTGSATFGAGGEAASAPKSVLKKPSKDVVVSVIPAEGEHGQKCAICCETLDRYFDEDKDEWMLRGVVKKQGVFYHQTCFNDAPGFLPVPEGASKRKLSPSRDVVVDAAFDAFDDFVDFKEDKKPKLE